MIRYVVHRAHTHAHTHQDTHTHTHVHIVTSPWLPTYLSPETFVLTSRKVSYALPAPYPAHNITSHYITSHPVPYTMCCSYLPSSLCTCSCCYSYLSRNYIERSLFRTCTSHVYQAFLIWLRHVVVFYFFVHFGVIFNATGGRPLSVHHVIIVLMKFSNFSQWNHAV